MWGSALNMQGENSVKNYQRSFWDLWLLVNLAVCLDKSKDIYEHVQFTVEVKLHCIAEFRRIEFK